MMQLEIDPFFRDYFPKLDYGQEQALRRSLLTGVTKEPLFYWVHCNTGKPTLLEGHHRYKLAQELRLEMEVEQKDFDSIKEAELFIIRHQTTRRNLDNHHREQLVKRAVALQMELEGKTKTEAVKDVAVGMGISEATAWRDVRPKTLVQQFYEDKKAYERDLERVRNKEVEKLKQRAQREGWADDADRLEAEWQPIESEIEEQFAEAQAHLETTAEAIQGEAEATGHKPSGGKRTSKKSTRDRAARRNGFKKALTYIAKFQNDVLYFWNQHGCGTVDITDITNALQMFAKQIEAEQEADAKAKKKKFGGR